MKYFPLLNNINYKDKKIKNIFYNYVIENLREDILIAYRLLPNDTLHKISYKFYDTTDYYWLIAKINGINDIFSVFNNDDLISDKANYLTDKYFEGKTYTTVEYNDKLLEFYNEEKQKKLDNSIIYIIDPQYISEINIKIIREMK